MRIITADLINSIKNRYRLDWHGIHGVSHWARVRYNGMILSSSEPHANRKIIEYFAFLHDSCRENDNDDPDHGFRASVFAKKIRKQVISLNDDEFDELCVALRGHTSGRWHNSVTVQCCWDSDRLDLGRVGIIPDPKRLLISAAKSSVIIEAALRRSGYYDDWNLI